MENNIPENRNPQRPAVPRPAGQNPAAQRPVGQNPAAQRPVVQNPAAQRPVAQNPAAQRPVAQNPAAQRPVAQNPAAQRPVAQNPAAQRPAAQNPAAQRPVAQNPAAQRPAAQNPAAQRPAAQNPAAQRPVAQNPAAQRPAGQNPAAQRPAAQNPAAQRPVAQNPAAQQPITPPPAAPAPEADSPTQSTASIQTEGAGKKKTTLSKAGAEMMSSAVKALIYIAAVFVVAIFLSIIIIRVGNDVFALVKSDEAIDITIPEDASLADIGNILHENSIISFPGIFTMYGNLKKDTEGFIPGDYTVSPAMSYDKLRAAFKPQPVVGTSWITIPEGYTVDEIISLMVSYGIGDRETYIDVINNYDFDYWFVKEIPENDGRHYRLEGYLFPDTYEFYNSSSEVTVINKLLARFDDVFADAYREKAKELGMTVDEIITIASLIEKEAGNAADYRYVSSVFHNRLNAPDRFPKLESDATTVYALQLANDGVRPENISADEIRNFDSPYNSYKYSGLIPGAIANPSASAIRYALYPTESNFYFFVAGVGGVTHFASTQAEHDQNIAMVKQQMQQTEE